MGLGKIGSIFPINFGGISCGGELVTGERGEFVGEGIEKETGSDLKAKM